jgi:hypothetical protein
MCRYVLHSALLSKIMRSHISAKLVNHFSYSSCMYISNISFCNFISRSFGKFHFDESFKHQGEKNGHSFIKKIFKNVFLCIGIVQRSGMLSLTHMRLLHAFMFRFLEKCVKFYCFVQTCLV